MRVLQVNKNFYARGGADTFFFKTCDLLTEQGHEVAHFSTKHPQNRPSPFEAYFVDGFNDSDAPHLSLVRKARVFQNGIYSFAANKNLARLLRDFKPDLTHIHSINYQLSPSVFGALRKTPVVMTLHDYHIICGAGSLYVNGAVCERCRGGRHYNLLTHSCYWNLPASLMATVSHYLHDALHSWDVASKFLSPSHFLKGKLTEFGIPAERITHVPIFIDFSEAPVESKGVGEYVLYFGRLDHNKGMKVLLEAAKTIDYKFLLIGDGPLSEWVEEQCAVSGGKLRRLAFVSSREELRGYIERAAFSVIPSVWYENQPATILETYAMGKPVIGSRLGGIPELIDEEHTGLLCEPGDPADLSQKIRFMLERPEVCRAWGRNGNRKLREGFSRAAHYERLMAVYSAVLSQN